jgi:hypothetical protein
MRKAISWIVGRDAIAKVKCMYREGTIAVTGMQGTIKLWHTADGRYRKEEQVGTFSSTATFDGKPLLVRKGGVREMIEGQAATQDGQDRSSIIVHSGQPNGD